MEEEIAKAQCIIAKWDAQVEYYHVYHNNVYTLCEGHIGVYLHKEHLRKIIHISEISDKIKFMSNQLANIQVFCQASPSSRGNINIWTVDMYQQLKLASDKLSNALNLVSHMKSTRRIHDLYEKFEHSPEYFAYLRNQAENEASLNILPFTKFYSLPTYLNLALKRMKNLENIHWEKETNLKTIIEEKTQRIREFKREMRLLSAQNSRLKADVEVKTRVIKKIAKKFYTVLPQLKMELKEIKRERRRCKRDFESWFEQAYEELSTIQNQIDELESRSKETDDHAKAWKLFNFEQGQTITLKDFAQIEKASKTVCNTRDGSLIFNLSGSGKDERILRYLTYFKFKEIHRLHFKDVWGSKYPRFPQLPSSSVHEFLFKLKL